MAEAPDFRRAFEVAPEVRLLLSSDGTVLAASNHYLSAIAATREHVVGRSIFELPPYATAPRSSQLLQDAIATLLRSNVVTPHALPDATPCVSGAHWLGATNVPIQDPAGQLVCLRHELQARHEAGTLHTDLERELRKLYENSYDAIALADGYGRFTFVTPSVRHVLGFSEQEFIDAPPMALVHPEDAPGFGEELNHLLAQPGSLARVRVRLRIRDGSWRTLECTVVNRLHDPDVSAVIATFRDVSQQVQLQNELRRSHEQLRVALSAARAISWAWDLSPESSTSPDDFGAFLLTSPESGNGVAAAREAIHPDDRARIRTETERCIETGEDFEVEFRGPPGDGEPRWYASHGQVLRDATHGTLRMVGITRDITERKRWEEERESLDRRVQEGQKLESLGVLAGGIAHDFNNILMAILGNASLTRNALPKDAAPLSYVVQIEEAARRAAELCRQMLAYAGKGRFVLSLTDLNGLIEETAQLLQVSISKKAVLRFHLHAKLPAIVADATQMRQVLMNLVINASDAIGERSGVISISTGVVRADRMYLDKTFLAPEIPEGDYVFLEVSDTGGGMNADTQARLFEPFFSTKFTGRGLGLAAVLGIVRGHKGALKVYSEVGKGSSFKFLLPVAQEDLEQAPLRALGSPPLSAQGTILLVDDEETVLAVTGKMLEWLGFKVVTASDGREAMDRYKEHAEDFTAVLMDLTMPHLDGEEAFRELRRINPEVRVLLMSGYNEQDAISRFVGKGLAGFIQKPFNIDELRDRLRLLLGA